jgi:hypothetical protein
MQLLLLPLLCSYCRCRCHVVVAAAAAVQLLLLLLLLLLLPGFRSHKPGPTRTSLALWFVLYYIVVSICIKIEFTHLHPMDYQPRLELIISFDIQNCNLHCVLK